MTVLIDSNVIIALLNSRDKNHNRSRELLTRLKDPDLGMRVTIDYVLNEVVTTLWMHTHRKEIVTKAYDLIHSTPKFIRFEHVNPSVLRLAWEKWQQLATWPQRSLSFTDCCILSFIEKHNIDHLATFDSHFDGLVSVL